MENLPFMLFTAAGIGFIIFVHELGHFLAARSVGVRVEAFSIGFGPKILAWTRGHTQYRLGLIPLGGYVKMAGEDPTRPTTGKDDEFGSKTVAQRVLVISAGVIMNMIFALVAIPLAFTIGVPFESPELGSVQPGGVAWRAGLLPGDRIVSINERRVLTFEDIPLDLAVADGSVDLEVQRGAARLHLQVTPEPDPVRGVPMIGVSPAAGLVRVAASAFAPDADDRPAARRKKTLEAAGLSVGTEIVRINGLPYRRDHWDAEAAKIRTSREPVILDVRDGDKVRSVTLAPLLDEEPKDGWRIGVALRRDCVLRVRPDSPAARSGLCAGDVLRQVNGRSLDVGSDLPFLVGGGIDPRRHDADTSIRALELVVLRAGHETRLAIAGLDRAGRAAFLDDVALDSLNALALDVLPGSVAAAAGLLSGDVLLSVNGTAQSSWDSFRDAIKAAGGNALALRVRRGAKEVECVVTALNEAENIILPALEEVPKSETVCLPVGDAIQTGFLHTGRVVRRVVQTLRSVFTGRVSGKHLGGIITIFRASVTYSQIAITRGLLFMALVSINLAILNILPIPVLDGGWLMFLIIERVRGKPLPERAMGWFQYGGLALVLGLMVYVTWNDIARLVGWM